jgi:hypothetical protein
MNLDKAVTLGEEAMDRDPRQAPLGFFAGGSFVLDSCRVFTWFDSMDKLAGHLWEVEPAIFNIDEPAELQDYQNSITPILDALKTAGFNEETRAQFNKAARGCMVIDWWGRFEDLVEAKSDFAKSLVAHFAALNDDKEDNKDNAPSIGPEDMDDFIDYLKTCGV